MNDSEQARGLGCVPSYWLREFKPSYLIISMSSFLILRLEERMRSRWLHTLL